MLPSLKRPKSSSDRQFDNSIGGTYIGGAFENGVFSYVPNFSVFTYMAHVDAQGKVIQEAPASFINQRMVGNEILIRRQSGRPSAGVYDGRPNSDIDYAEIISPIIKSTRNLDELEEAVFSSFDAEFFIVNSFIKNPVRFFSSSSLFCKGSGDFPFKIEGSLKGEQLIHINEDLRQLLIGCSFLNGCPVVDP